jgi:hypothetical protein
MMNTFPSTGMTGLGSGMFALHLHWFFGAFAIVGFILLTVWALKNLSGEKLKSFTMWILVIGIIGTLLTAPFAAKGIQWMVGAWHGNYGMKHSMMNGSMMQMMDMMMGHDEGATGKSHEDHKEMQEMMEQMMEGRWHDTSGNVRSGMMMHP